MPQSIDKPGLVRLKTGSSGWRSFYTVLVAAACLLTGASPAQAGHIKSIQIRLFQNPAGWTGLYDPGPVVSKTLEWAARKDPNLILVPFAVPTGAARAQTAPHPPQGGNPMQPAAAMTETKTVPPANFLVQGRVFKFIPDLKLPGPGPQAEPQSTGLAEIQIQVRVVHTLTGRTVAETSLWAVGEGGALPFPATEQSLIPGHADFQNTSMGRALEQVAARTLNFLETTLAAQSLDSQVLLVDEPGERLTINVGKIHGVRVRDRFTVYQMTLRFEDPITHADLGDRLELVGEIQVLNVGEKFSEVVILAGEGFAQGQLARLSQAPKPLPVFVRQGQRPFASTSAGRFGQPHDPLNTPNTTLTDLDFFSLFGFSLGY